SAARRGPNALSPAAARAGGAGGACRIHASARGAARSHVTPHAAAKKVKTPSSVEVRSGVRMKTSDRAARQRFRPGARYHRFGAEHHSSHRADADAPNVRVHGSDCATRFETPVGARTREDQSNDA